MSKWLKKRRGTIEQLQNRGHIKNHLISVSNEMNNNEDETKYDNSDDNNINNNSVSNGNNNTLSVNDDLYSNDNNSKSVHYGNLLSSGNVFGTDNKKFGKHTIAASMESTHSMLSVGDVYLSDDDDNLYQNDNELFDSDLYELHNHQTIPHYNPQKKEFYSLYNESDINNNNNDNNKTKTIYSSSYFQIPEYLEGGLLSSGIFIAYKHWCESSIVRFTEKAGEYLTDMKRESEQLEELQRQNINRIQYVSNTIYDDNDTKINNTSNNNSNGNSNDIKKLKHLENLSDLDENLADTKDKIHKMFTVQNHIKSIQQQFDTHINNLREDYNELLNMTKELEERKRQCQLIYNQVSNNEVWLIQNIANTIAERAEKIDSMNKRIKKMRINNKAKIELNNDLENTKHFIEDLNVCIRKLQNISLNKSQEIDALKTNIELLKRQGNIMNGKIKNSQHTVHSRLLELQKYYKLPNIMKDIWDTQGRSASTITSVMGYIDNVNINDYYERCLELYLSKKIYCNKKCKLFLNSFVLLCSTIFVDCILCSQYIKSNMDNNHNNNNNNNSNNSDNNSYDNIYDSSNYSLYDDDEILKQALNPVKLRVSNHSHHSFKKKVSSFNNSNNNDGINILNDLLSQQKFDGINLIDVMKNNSINNDNNDINLYDKINIIYQWTKSFNYRTTVLNYIGQHITMKHINGIRNMENHEIRDLSLKQCNKLFINAIYTYNNNNGIIKTMLKQSKNIKNIKKNFNVYTIASQILYKCFNIIAPSPVIIS